MSLAQTTVQIPEEIAGLINVVAERWGYYFGKRAIQSELMKATQVERATVKSIGAKIGAKIEEYMNNGTDVRAEVKALQGELAKARASLKEKSEPFYEKLRPLNKALSFLDKKVIPDAIEKATGEKVLPRYQVSDYIVKALTPKK